MLNGAVAVHRVCMDDPLPGTVAPADEDAVIAAVLEPAEQQRAARFLRPGDGRRWARVRTRLRQLLSERCGTPAHAIRFSVGEHGKPCLRTASHASACPFNVSHACRQALVVLGQRGQLGVDIERIERRRDSTALAATALDAAERQAFARLPDGEQDAGFIQAWVRKEAVLKALGVGLGFGLQRVHVGLQPLACLRIDGRDALEWELEDLCAPAGYRAALCREAAPRGCAAC